MLRNYLKVAFRTLRRRPGYTAINVGGLAVGLAACLLIGLWVQRELSYDDFHEKADRIYRVALGIKQAGQRTEAATSMAELAPALRRTLPEVQRAVRLFLDERVVERGNQRFSESQFLYADSTFFEVFSFPLAKGNPKTALDQPASVILTQPMAAKYFGDENPLGRALTVGGETYTVTGVARDVPSNSHVQFGFVAPFSALEASSDENWLARINYYTYVLLPQQHDPAALASKVKSLIQQNITDAQQQAGVEVFPALQPLTQIYLGSDRMLEIGPTGDRATLYIFALIALFILGIACVNYMNLATAQSARRAKEVGVRRTVGARREQLAGRFLSESVLVSMAALGLALLLCRLALPAFSTLAGKSLSLDLGASDLLLLGGMALGVGLLAGSYPAFLLSSFKPASILRGSAHSKKRGRRLRQGLVVLQFAVTIAVIAGTLVVRDQLSYVQSRDLGFDEERVVTLPLQDSSLRGRYAAFKKALTKHPQVASASASYEVPGNGSFGLSAVDAEGFQEGDLPPMRWLSVGPGFLETFDIELTAGRDFSKKRGTDSTTAFVLNEAAVNRLGWDDPVGKDFAIPGVGEGRVIGVAENFHFASLHQRIEPLAMAVAPQLFRFMSVKVRPGDPGSSPGQALDGTLAFLERTHQAWTAGQPFDYFFVDAAFDRQYRADERFGRVFAVFAGLAIVIACLGLFGLATFAAERRRKEIAVRKTFGATTRQLVTLLSKDFLKLVAVGFAIATPLAWYAMRRWLEGFAYRIELGPLVFLAAGALALVVALGATGAQALRAARANPAEALRDE